MHRPPLEFAIASPHTSPYWYEYRNYVNLIEAGERLGLRYVPKTQELRIYFLGWPSHSSYKDVGFFDPCALNVAYVTSHPDRVNLKFLMQFDYVITTSTSYSKYIEKLVKRHDPQALHSPKIHTLYPFSSLMPCMSTTSSPDSPSSLNESNESNESNKPYPNYECDVAFVGNIRRRPIVEMALPVVKKHNLNFKIWGYNWKDYQGNPEAKQYWWGDVIPYYDIPLLARHAKFILHDHHGTMNSMGITSHKYIDYFMSKARVVSDYNPEVQRLGGKVVRNSKELEAVLTGEDPVNDMTPMFEKYKETFPTENFFVALLGCLK